ncbi:hypothetical protein HK102_003706 [Quaeritorhiza haematococci]|nr:hypothetical protein HK102_003706 [Quaeritorhiza haematococci]
MSAAFSIPESVLPSSTRTAEAVIITGSSSIGESITTTSIFTSILTSTTIPATTTSIETTSTTTPTAESPTPNLTSSPASSPTPPPVADLPVANLPTSSISSTSRSTQSSGATPTIFASAQSPVAISEPSTAPALPPSDNPVGEPPADSPTRNKWGNKDSAERDLNGSIVTEGSSRNIGALAGGLTGGIFAVALLIGAFAFVYRRRRRGHIRSFGSVGSLKKKTLYDFNSTPPKQVSKKSKDLESAEHAAIQIDKEPPKMATSNPPSMQMIPPPPTSDVSSEQHAFPPVPSPASPFSTMDRQSMQFSVCSPALESPTITGTPMDIEARGQLTARSESGEHMLGTSLESTSTERIMGFISGLASVTNLFQSANHAELLQQRLPSPTSSTSSSTSPSSSSSQNTPPPPLPSAQHDPERSPSQLSNHSTASQASSTIFPPHLSARLERRPSIPDHVLAGEIGFGSNSRVFQRRPSLADQIRTELLPKLVDPPTSTPIRTTPVPASDTSSTFSDEEGEEEVEVEVEEVEVEVSDVESVSDAGEAPRVHTLLIQQRIEDIREKHMSIMSDQSERKSTMLDESGGKGT